MKTKHIIVLEQSGWEKPKYYVGMDPDSKFYFVDKDFNLAAEFDTYPQALERIQEIIRIERKLPYSTVEISTEKITVL